MTAPITDDQLPYLHIDDLSVHVPAETDLVRLTKNLAAAAAKDEILAVRIVDEAGEIVNALISPARARIVAASKHPVIVPRKGIPPR
jgi:hypothetical protein